MKEEFQRAEGETEIEWLTEADRRLLKLFETPSVLSGAWNNKHRQFWAIIWVAQLVTFQVLYVYSAYLFKSEVHLLAHVLHHAIMTMDDMMYLHLIYCNKDIVETVHRGLTTTFNYNSSLIDGYHRQNMNLLLQSARHMLRLILAGVVVTALNLELFYILEATFLKTYVTMIPMYFPFNVDHFVTYTIAVFFQHLQIFITIIMIAGLSAYLFVARSHICIELDCLTFAMTQIEHLVKEKLQTFNCKTFEEETQARAEIYKFYCYNFARHHAAIFRYFKAFNDSVGVAIFMFFFTGLICFACVGITSVADNLGIKLKFLAIMAVQSAFIFAWCWVSQDFADKNEGLTDILATMPWWKMPQQCRTSILVMMVGCRRKMWLRTYFGQAANNESFMNMASNSYQIFNLVYQMKFVS